MPQLPSALSSRGDSGCSSTHRPQRFFYCWRLCKLQLINQSINQSMVINGNSMKTAKTVQEGEMKFARALNSYIPSYAKSHGAQQLLKDDLHAPTKKEEKQKTRCSFTQASRPKKKKANDHAVVICSLSIIFSCRLYSFSGMLPTKEGSFTLPPASPSPAMGRL